MSNLMRIYKNLLIKYPVASQAVQAGIFMAVGDQIAQNAIERREFKNLDFTRSAQFAGIGFCLVGPTTRMWYGILDKYIGSKGGIVVLKKVACDQLLFAPVFIGALLSVIGLSQGHDIESLQKKLKDEYPDVIKNNYKLWPMVQLVNFYFIPLQYQVLLVQSVALLWSSYISYRTSQGTNRKIHI